MRPTGRLHLGHLVGALQNWVALQSRYDCFFFVADWHALTSEYASTGADRRERARQRGRLDRCGHRPGDEHVVRAVARARACGALSAAADGHAGPVARAGAHLQGADRAARREGPVEHRVPRISAPADGGRDHLRRPLRAGRRRSGSAPRAVARGRAPLPQFLRRAVRRASAAAHPDTPAAGARQPEDEQELRQHDRSRPTRPRPS